MSSRLSALVIWAAVAASLAYWGLRWLAQPIAVPANALSVSMDSGSKGDFRRLLSGPAAASPQAIDAGAQSALAGRIQLQGAFASGDASGFSGVALLSVDGQPPRAVRVGQALGFNLETMLGMEPETLTSLLELCFAVNMGSKGYELASQITRHKPSKAMLDRIRTSITMFKENSLRNAE